MKKMFCLFLFFIIIFCSFTNTKADKYKLSEEQKYYSEEIAQECITNWNQYGVLPSVAIAQAYCESGIGRDVSSYNWWGISQHEPYNCFEDALHGYLNTLNNGYYSSALYCTEPEEQIRAIAYSGYCAYPEDYIAKVMWTIRTYDLSKYDNILYELARKKTYNYYPVYTGF